MAANKPLQLESLPVEIIHRILAHGPCTNVLTVSCVSQRLRVISTNPLLYQDIIENENGFHIHKIEDWQAVPLEWWITRGLNAERDWRICARWALADMKIRKATLERHKVQTNMLDMLSFLPELLSQRHQVALDFIRPENIPAEDVCCDLAQHHYDTRSTKFNLQLGDAEGVARAAFIYTCHCTLMQKLSREATAPPSYDIRRDPHHLDWYLPPKLSHAISNFLAIWEDDGDLWNARTLLTSTNMMSTWQNNREQELHWLRCIMLSTVIVGILYRRISLALDRQPLSGLVEDGRIVKVQPPKASHINLESLFQNVASPFIHPEQPSETSSFITRHIPHMTTPEFLTDGEWVGYYNHTVATGQPEWDPLMHGIFFHITADYADHCAITAKGSDAIGPFTLLGIINKTTGWIQMTKEYVETGHNWRWSAIMTAFGIVGAWGEDWGGWFWLWKRAWSCASFLPPPD